MRQTSRSVAKSRCRQQEILHRVDPHAPYNMAATLCESLLQGHASHAAAVREEEAGGTHIIDERHIQHGTKYAILHPISYILFP